MRISSRRRDARGKENYLAPINVSRIYSLGRIPFVFLPSSRSHLKSVPLSLSLSVRLPLSARLFLTRAQLRFLSSSCFFGATPTSGTRRSSLFNLFARRRRCDDDADDADADSGDGETADLISFVSREKDNIMLFS